MQDYNPFCNICDNSPQHDCGSWYYYISPDRGRVVEFYNANRMNI